MSEIFNPKYNDLPTQVEVNRRNIEELKKHIKDAYTTTIDYGDDEGYPILSVPLTTTTLPQDAEVGAFSGFMITKDSVLTNIINIDYEYISEVQTKVVNASYVCSLKGPKGDTGERGERGLKGEKGDSAKIYSSEYVPVGNVEVGTISNIPWSSTNIPVDPQNYPRDLILVGNGWFYQIEGYTTSSDISGYDLICSAVAKVTGENGRDGTLIYSTSVQDIGGEYITIPIETTNIPATTELGDIDGLLVNGSAKLYNRLSIIMNGGIKCVRAYYVTSVKGPKGDVGPTGLGYRYETVDFAGEQWVADSTTLPGYNYKIFGYIPDVTADTFVDIKFSYEDIMKFVYAPVCISTTDGVYIYSITNSEVPTDVGALVYEEG